MKTTAEKLIDLLEREDELILAPCTADISEVTDLAESLANVSEQLESLIDDLEPDVVEIVIVQVTTVAGPVSN